jgi:hypothetical protein
MKRIILASALVFLALPKMHAQDGNSGLGTVKELPEACPAGPIANTTCRRLEVACPGLKPLSVQTRITEPPAGVALRGTVVLGSGSGGFGFYGGQEGGAVLIKDLAAIGFRCVDRAWAGGWTTGEGGLKKEACRYATLLTWIHGHIHTKGKFIASGNSGGSAELGYAITSWGRAGILDVAVVTSGPPTARLDYTCAKQPSPEWAALCASIVPPGVMECAKAPGCTVPPTAGICTQFTEPPTPELLLNDSVANPKAVLNYPKTRMYFLYGARDCAEPVPAGLTWATKVTSQKTIRFVTKTPHPMFSTPEGREAIRQAIEEGASQPAAPMK